MTMTKHIASLFKIKVWLAVSLLMVSGLQLQLSTPKQSWHVSWGVQAMNQPVKDKRKKRKTPLIRSKIFKKIEAVQNFLQEDNFQEGIEILNSLKARAQAGKLNSYEVAQMWNMFAFAYFNQEKYSDAIIAYEQVLKQKSIPWVMEDGTLYSLAQLHFVNQNLTTAVSYIDRWLKSVPNPSPQALVFKGQIHYQNKEMSLAYDSVKKGVALADKKQLTVKESWLQLLSFLYYERKDIDNSIKILERLVSINPKKSYISQLSGMYMLKGRNKEQISLYRALYERGNLTEEKELITLASLYINESIPVKAGLILEKGFEDKIIKPTKKNLELLGNAWHQAHELKKSIVWLEKAAELSENGKIHLRLAATHLDLERFDDSVRSAKQALKLSGLSKEVSAHIVMGSAYFYQKKFDESLMAFGKVLELDKNSKIAKQWIKYITTEKKKQEHFELFMKS